MNGGYSSKAPKKSFKCVLLNNRNKLAGVPVGHSVVLKEYYHTIKMVLEKLCYSVHNWMICVDFKMANFLLGQQSGYTKYPCFLCYWESQAMDQHWMKNQ